MWGSCSKHQTGFIQHGGTRACTGAAYMCAPLVVQPPHNRLDSMVVDGDNLSGHRHCICAPPVPLMVQPPHNRLHSVVGGWVGTRHTLPQLMHRPWVQHASVVSASHARPYREKTLLLQEQCQDQLARALGMDMPPSVLGRVCGIRAQ